MAHPIIIQESTLRNYLEPFKKSFDRPSGRTLRPY
jgi:hypothetical protein